MMYRNLTLLSLAALSLCACKPTPRTAHTSRRPQPPAEQPAQQPAEQPATPTQQAGEQPAATAQQAATAPTATQQEKISADAPLLIITVTRQGFNRLTPWEKQDSSTRRLSGTYLGNGMVLTYGKALQNATYAELSLPDGTRTVPARIVSYDPDLALALLTTAHEQDAAIFDTRHACRPGEPLLRSQTAELWCTLNGSEPLRVPLLAQVGTVGDNLPRLSLQANMAVPDVYAYGAPVMKDGKLVGLSAGYESTGRKLSIINSELLQRFLQRPANAPTGTPSLGIEVATLEDPVFRRYLKLQEGQTGIYISKVIPVSAAATADLREGDVITAIEGMKVDNLGRCDLPIYGPTHISVASRYLRPLGDTLQLTVSRAGELKDITVPLNTDAKDKALLATEQPDKAPRYAVWGGLVFQPLTDTYIQTLKSQAHGNLPVEFLELDSRSTALREQGIRELTALTLVIPTPTTLGYDNLGFCVVEKVNGKTPRDFTEFVQLLDEPTPTGLVEFTLNKPPYRIYMEHGSAAAVNDNLRRNAIPHLRRVE